MILATCKETGLPAYILDNQITSMESHGGSSPFTRIWIKNDRENFEYWIDVTESQAEIKRRIKEEKLTPGVDVNAE